VEPRINAIKLGNQRNKKKEPSMSKLTKMTNGFDAITGAAFGSGSGSGSGSGGGSNQSARSPINSHPSAMSSSQYNNSYDQGGNGNAHPCVTAAVLGGLASAGKGAKSSIKGGGIPTPAGAVKDFGKGAVVAGGMCVISSYW